VFASSSDWFTWFSVVFVIGWFDFFGFELATVVRRENLQSSAKTALKVRRYEKEFEKIVANYSQFAYIEN